ncbi:MAG: 30S ribosomal protein S17 [Parcubacteria group bacterium QH_9_35_7]|nr:MAG: 30S ribosomal protein S17 [Parcubacteria group bacterium QH_9_35_7]
MEQEEPIKRKFEGTVVSDKENKTLRVEVERLKQHPLYKKRYTVTKKYAVHDEDNEGKEGDVVQFQECRPISKTKRWRLTDIVESS